MGSTNKSNQSGGRKKGGNNGGAYKNRNKQNVQRELWERNAREVEVQSFVRQLIDSACEIAIDQ